MTTPLAQLSNDDIELDIYHNYRSVTKSASLWANTEELWAEFDSTVVAVMRNVVQRDMNRHGGLLRARA